jgi:hypothetical protein
MSRSHRARSFGIATRWILAVALALAVVTACGGDDDDDDDAAAGDAEASYCDERDDLSEDVDELANVDLLGDGVNGVRDALDDVEEGAQEVRETGSDVVGDEVDALQSAVDGLRSAISEIGDSGIGQENRQGVADAVETVRTAGSDLVDALETDCG